MICKVVRVQLALANITAFAIPSTGRGVDDL